MFVRTCITALSEPVIHKITKPVNVKHRTAEFSIELQGINIYINYNITHKIY